MQSRLSERLRALPCAAPLLAIARERGGGVHLVGGAVRDLLLGRDPAELDIVVEGDPEPVASALGCAGARHDRFATASVQARDGCRYDVAMARAERYPSPGALPDVRPAGIEEDLGRRDVTVNAMALDLASGTLRAAPHAYQDLAAGRLRVLHDASFEDDPTRLWRIARYAARLRFALEPRTAALAARAVDARALATVSGTRIGNELRLALREPDPVTALERAAALRLAPWLRPDRERARAALELLDGEGRSDLVVLACALHGEPSGLSALLDKLGFRADERRLVLVARGAPRPLGSHPSALLAAFAGLPAEAVALSADREAAARWLGELRRVGLKIGGDDLLAAGVPQGPEVGRRLHAALAGLLDGEVAPGRESELRAALDA